MDEQERLTRIAEFVRKIRLGRGGLTQREAAGRAGVSETTWNQVERAQSVSDRMLAKIATWVGVDFDDLQAGKLDLAPEVVVLEGVAPGLAGLTGVEDLTPEEMARVIEYARFVRSQRT